MAPPTLGGLHTVQTTVQSPHQDTEYITGVHSIVYNLTGFKTGNLYSEVQYRCTLNSVQYYNNTSVHYTVYSITGSNKYCTAKYSTTGSNKYCTAKYNINVHYTVYTVYSLTGSQSKYTGKSQCTL